MKRSGKLATKIRGCGSERRCVCARKGVRERARKRERNVCLCVRVFACVCIYKEEGLRKDSEFGDEASRVQVCEDEKERARAHARPVCVRGFAFVCLQESGKDREKEKTCA